MLIGALRDYPPTSSAIQAIAHKFGCRHETLRYSQEPQDMRLQTA